MIAAETESVVLVGPSNFQTATHLRNGARIVKRRSQDNDFVVLCHWEGHTAPWVTWRLSLEGDAFWGHYFHDQAEAEADFYERSPS